MYKFKMKAIRGSSVYKFDLIADDEEKAIREAKEMTHNEFKISIVKKSKYLNMI